MWMLPSRLQSYPLQVNSQLPSILLIVPLFLSPITSILHTLFSNLQLRVDVEHFLG